jgi:hypothetical protein
MPVPENIEVVKVLQVIALELQKMNSTLREIAQRSK